MRSGHPPDVESHGPSSSVLYAAARASAHSAAPGSRSIHVGLEINYVCVYGRRIECGVEAAHRLW